MKVQPRILVFAILPIVIAYYFWSYPPNPWTWMQTVGVCLMAIGFPLWLTAHVQLGSAFAVAAEARTLVTHGLYSRIRSPIYIFGSIGIAGAFLMLGRPYLLLLFAILIPLQVVRTRKEARVLEEKFGQEYLNYRRSTWI
jgi:protein-S-isoprenylcysteine O-methyltransferase Ste14